ncbi:MAG TPA: hypothetical protein VL309_06375 [Vicinamibacterales bacterium]|jgi:hypothetical protein|nr:hypothetical protein [Vicinamibacterales bacterium]
MTTLSIKLLGVGPKWAHPCQQAVTDLNALFKRSGIAVVLALGGSKGPVISVRTDPSIQGDAVHGKTNARLDGSGRTLSADVRLPVKVSINTPQGIRDAGAGIFEVIAAHEFVHALGHSAHTSQLMGQTMYKELGDHPAGDRLKTGNTRQPPLSLSPDTIDTLKGIWN